MCKNNAYNYMMGNCCSRETGQEICTCCVKDKPRRRSSSEESNKYIQDTLSEISDDDSSYFTPRSHHRLHLFVSELV